MDAKRWGQIKEIYVRAIDLCGDERENFLAEACAGAADLRREVETLLAAHEGAGTFLQSPAFEVAARELAGQSVSGAQTRPLANPAPQRIGAYRLLEPLGHGGMGEVYLALEAAQPFGVIRELRRQQLERDLAMQAFVFGQIDLAHSASAQQ